MENLFYNIFMESGNHNNSNTAFEIFALESNDYNVQDRKYRVRIYCCSKTLNHFFSIHQITSTKLTLHCLYLPIYISIVFGRKII